MLDQIFHKSNIINLKLIIRGCGPHNLDRFSRNKSYETSHPDCPPPSPPPLNHPSRPLPEIGLRFTAQRVLLVAISSMVLRLARPVACQE